MFGTIKERAFWISRRPGLLFFVLNLFRNAQILEIFRGVFEAAAKVFVSAVHCDGFAGAEFEIVHGFRCWRREITTIFCREYLTNFCRRTLEPVE